MMDLRVDADGSPYMGNPQWPADADVRKFTTVNFNSLNHHSQFKPDLILSCRVSVVISLYHGIPTNHGFNQGNQTTAVNFYKLCIIEFLHVLSPIYN